jgi:hypothetical protein
MSSFSSAPRGRAVAPNGQNPDGTVWQARDNGITWNPGAAEVVAGRTSIDPNTGSLVGPDSLIPHQLGLQYQAEHDRRIFDYRQRLMRDANSYGRGALGLMQSFRPGGGATLEAGQYNTLAQIQLNRAQLTTPMDLLGDYRRHENAVARQKANRAAERQMAVQIGVALAGVAATAATGGAAAPLLAAGIGAAGNAYAGYQNAQAANANAGAADTMAQTQQLIGQQGGNQMGAAPGQAPQQQGGGAPGQAAAPFPQIGPAAEPQAMGGGQAVQAPGAQGAQGGQQPGQGMKRVGGQPGQGGGSGAGMGAAGAMGGGPGADGVFTPTAYASYGALQQNPIQRAMLTSQLADALDDDPFYDSFTFAVNARFAQRMQSA